MGHSARRVARTAGRLVTACTLLAPAVAAVDAVGPPVVTAMSSTDLLVGDSVMAGMGSASRSTLPNHRFDAEVCRRLVATSCTYQGVRPATALDVIRANAGAIDRAIVVAAGYNDSSIGSAVDAIVAEARRQGVPYVVWLTYRVAGSYAGVYRSHNSVLTQKASQYPELRIADWASFSAGRSDWVASDGHHLNASGARAMADLIGATLAGLAPPGPPPIERSDSACFAVAGPVGAGALVNLTPVLGEGAGHGVLTSGRSRPAAAASNVNFGSGTVDPNVAIAPVGNDGRVCFHNSEHARVHLVADQLGTLAPAAYSTTGGGTPMRLIDTRRTGERVPASGSRCFGVDGNPGDAAIVNLTPVEPTAPGHGVLTARASDAPVASSVNYRPGAVDPNLVIAPIGPDRRVCFHASVHASVHLVADQLGAVASAHFTPADPSGIPIRLTDTRASDRPVAPTERRCFATGAPPRNVAVVNLTPVLAGGFGHGVLTSSDTTGAPDASNVNYRPGSTDPNLAVARVGGDGRVCFFASSHTSLHLVVDLIGTFTAGSFTLSGADGGPVRRLDTRAR